MNNVIFDKLKPEYIDSLSELENKCFTVPWSKELFKNDLNNNNAFYVLAISDGNVVAYGGMYTVLDEADITNIAVHPLYRKQGIASTILNKMFE